MPKERWAHAEEIESNPKTPLENHEINAESYNLPVLSLEIGDSDNIPVEEKAARFLSENPEVTHKIVSENLDVVAHEVVKTNGKAKWILIIGFGFAALGLGVAGYKILRKYSKEK